MTRNNIIARLSRDYFVGKIIVQVGFNFYIFIMFVFIIHIEVIKWGGIGVMTLWLCGSRQKRSLNLVVGSILVYISK